MGGASHAKITGDKAMTNFARTLGLWLAAVSSLSAARKPLALHPDNPHYFVFRGQPTVLISSGEHYGAVLNLDFDYVKYLETLCRDGLNLTRTFSGAYVEPAGAFNIASNTRSTSLAAARRTSSWNCRPALSRPNGSTRGPR